MRLTVANDISDLSVELPSSPCCQARMGRAVLPSALKSVAHDAVKKAVPTRDLHAFIRRHGRAHLRLAGVPASPAELIVV
jgi:hypothetical protein